ncbi:hypothetical protein D1007_04127 [Hordeum vulgare]|nr:hypothetical protein D1007_04127 [Hordeum vulgare]
MMVKKSSWSGEKTNVVQLYGGLGIQLRGKSNFPQMSFLDSVKGWQDSWFYYQDVSVGDGHTGLPPYSVERVHSTPSLTMSKSERVDVEILVKALVAFVLKGVNGMDLLEVFF